MDNESRNPNGLAETEPDTHDTNAGTGYSFDFARGIYPLATLIYLILGLRFGLWHPGWVVFFVACLVDALAEYSRTGRLKISVWGVAAVIFVISGFVFGAWGYAWLVFVAAWVVDEMLVPPTKKKKPKESGD